MYPLVSIIVPVFNAECFLADCIQSLLDQTYKNLEILLIDNTSTDASLQICLYYSHKDKRIHIYSNSVPGVSSTRNVGLKYANGQFISFVDADDKIHPKFIEVLLNFALHENADIVFCKFGRYRAANFASSRSPELNQHFSLTKFDFLYIVFSLRLRKFDAFMQYGGHIGNKIFSKTCISGALFEPQIKGAEDEFFIYSIRSRITKVIFVPAPLYLYNLHNNSLHNSRDFYYHTLNNRKFLAAQSKSPLEQRMLNAAIVKSSFLVARNLFLHSSINLDLVKQAKEVIPLSLDLVNSKKIPNTYTLGKYFIFDYLLLFCIHLFPTPLLLRFFKFLNNALSLTFKRTSE